MGGMGPILVTPPAVKGHVLGFVVKYSSATAAKITSGTFESDRTIYTLSADATHAMTSLVSAFDHHYIYLDKSASASSAPIFYDETTEPVFDPARNGWYHPTNAEDRLVGTMPSTPGAATLVKVATRSEGNGISLESGVIDFPTMAANMDPTGVWQSPATTAGSVVTPVNATALRFYIINNDAASKIILYITAVELASLGGSVVNAQFLGIGHDAASEINCINLGASRNVYIAGLDTNDNKLGCLCAGYIYKR